MTGPNRALLLAASGIRQAYLNTRLRIRQWGALPARRGPVVLIANHQYIDEGEIVFARAFWGNPRIGVICVNSRRSFETGFFATRLPHTAAFTSRLNLSRLWSQLGILPVENHLFSRPLTSLAAEIRVAHGDLPIAAILTDDVLAELGLNGRRLSELQTREGLLIGRTTVKLSRLREPYRREALERLRATVASDVATVVEHLRTGLTFYVTPEGDFSHDGRLRPMRNTLLAAVLAVAEPWLSAIAYDPFRGRRLPMLYRILRPPRTDDLGVSLAASRPVTTSALLATEMLATPAALTAAEAVAGVRAQLAALPPGAFVDPEVLRDPDAVVREALTNLIARGVLAAEGPRYRLTATRADPRFPHVADMVSFQRNMLAETLEAARTLA